MTRAIAALMLGMTMAAGVCAVAGDEPAPKKLTPEEQTELEAEWKELNIAGVRGYQAGKLGNATTALEKALEVARRLYPKQDHPKLANSLINLARVLQDRGKFADAEPLYREAVEMTERLYKGDHEYRILAQTGLGLVLQHQGKLTEAKQSYRAALQMAKRFYQRDHPETAAILASLGALHIDLGDLPEAETLLTDATTMYRRLFPKDKFPDGHPALAVSLGNLGQLLAKEGKLTEAEARFQETLRMFQRLIKRDNPYTVNALNSLAGVLHEQGELEEAEPLFRDALAMQQRLFKGDNVGTSHCLNNLAALLKDQKKYTDAEGRFQDALAMRKRLFKGDDHRTALSLNNLATVLNIQGKYAKAEEIYDDALKMQRRLFKGDHPDTALTLSNLAICLYRQGKHVEAEPLCQEALGMTRALVSTYAGQKSEGEALTLLAMMPDRQKFFLANALARKSAPPTVYREVWTNKGAIARVYERRALSARAAASDLKAAALLDKLGDRRRRRAELLLVPTPTDPKTRKERDNSIAGYAKEIEDLDRELRPLLPAVDRADKLTRATPADLQQVLPAETAVVDFLRYTSIEQDTKQPGVSREKQTASYLAFVVTKDKVDWIDLGPAKPIEDAVAAWRDAIAGERFKLTDKVLASLRTAGMPEAVVSKLATLKDEEFETREHFLPELAKALDKEELRRFQDLVLNHAITGGKDIPPELPAKVRELAWAKVRKEFPDGVKVVYVSPDLALCRVPWAALPGDKPNTILLEDKYAVAVIPHANFLLDKLWPQDPPRNRPAGVLVVGGVAYDAELSGPSRGVPPPAPLLKPGPTAGWSALDNTAGEAQGVARAAERKKLAFRSLTKEEAASSAVLAALPKVRYAHLATHGFFADSSFRSVFQVDHKLFEMTWRGERVGAGALSPLVMTGLVFAGANKPKTPGRGIVTGESLVDLDLSGLDLAVLSACETGLGDVAGGEGTFGLQRAFHLAGTRDVVASLWKVSDQATAALMAEFYRNLWEKEMLPVEALRQAQLTIYRSTPEKRATLAAGFRGTFKVVAGSAEEVVKPGPDGKAHPRLWAAFTLSGSGR